MKLTHLALGIISLALVGGTAALALRQSAPLTPKPTFDWQLPQVNGGTSGLSQNLGKVTLINFWASWCGTCREEMPDIVKAYRDYHNRGFQVLGINYGEGQADASQFVRQYGMTFPVFLDSDKAVAGKFGVISMPTSFLLDQNGEIVETIPGQIDFSEVRPKIEKMLGAE